RLTAAELELELEAAFAFGRGFVGRELELPRRRELASEPDAHGGLLAGRGETRDERRQALERVGIDRHDRTCRVPRDVRRPTIEANGAPDDDVEVAPRLVADTLVGAARKDAYCTCLVAVGDARVIAAARAALDAIDPPEAREAEAHGAARDGEIRI